MRPRKLPSIQRRFDEYLLRHVKRAAASSEEYDLKEGERGAINLVLRAGIEALTGEAPEVPDIEQRDTAAK